ncbi:hypothetical protein PULV_a4006 [Pseudoalteromonas ulvae UL12]|nr:hypothetical protein [Pseudoalteromonas ulvae UL12]
MLVSCFASAETFVVFDSGKARDIEVYYGKGEQYVPKKPFTNDDVKKALDAQFPLVSHLPMESFNSYKIETKLPYNIAVVGTDETSQNWLQRNFKKIKDSRAVVLVIDAKTLSEFTAFENVLRRAGLSVGKVESKMFDSVLNAYPALIINGEVSQ